MSEKILVLSKLLGVKTPNEIRAEEGLPLIKDGDNVLIKGIIPIEAYDGDILELKTLNRLRKEIALEPINDPNADCLVKFD